MVPSSNPRWWPLAIVLMLAGCTRAGFDGKATDLNTRESGEEALDLGRDAWEGDTAAAEDGPSADMDSGGAMDTTADMQRVPSVTWAKRFGAALDDTAYGVAVDNAGNVAIAGRFEGVIDFGGGGLTSAGGLDGFVASFDGAGRYRWARRFGAGSLDDAWALAMDAGGNVFTTGRFAGSVDFGGGAVSAQHARDSFVASYDTNGNYRWAARFRGTGSEEGVALAVLSQGDVILSGGFDGTIDCGRGSMTSAGGFDAFVARVDSLGNCSWMERIGGTGEDFVTAVARDGSDNVYLAGYFAESITLGATDLTSAGSRDVLLASFDGAGSLRWARGVGGNSIDSGLDVAVAGELVVVTGFFSSEMQTGTIRLTHGAGRGGFALAVDRAGANKWGRSIASTNNSYAESVVIAQDRVIISGRYFGSATFGSVALVSEGGTDLFVVEYDLSGGVRLAYGFGGTGNDFSSSLALDGAGRLIMAGAFAEDLGLGTFPLVATGGGVRTDVFLAQIGR